MNTFEVNAALSAGDCKSPGVLPKLDELRDQPLALRFDFGLRELPETPGLLLVRGARQYGKSTWLQQQIRETVKRHGPGAAFYLTGDELRDGDALVQAIRAVLPLYSARAAVRRLFIDEITAVADWQRALKILLDAGELRHVLVVTTGSKAADLRHGAERLPGRKGQLARSHFLFTPISYAEFKRACGARLPAEHHVPAYLISGGAPCACVALATHGYLPEYVVEMVRDWVYGEVARTGRSRPMLVGVMDCLVRFAGTPVGQSKLAREAALANNSVAAGYVDLLSDLLCVATAFAWDESHRRANRRRPCKFHFTNLLAAIAWHPQRVRSPAGFLAMSNAQQATMTEWLVAQELWRRAAIRGDEFPELMAFWQGPGHEVDFVTGPDSLIEVKRGRTGPLDFVWFPAVFPKARLTVVGATRFETDRIVGITIEDFLLGESGDSVA
jgi:predicted AAA+ superfamily ATPase